jgi:general secretion pathway protein A
MYKEYWNLKEKPFENTPDPKFFFSSSHHEEALMRLYYVIKERKGAGILTGEYGSGKTILTRFIVRELSYDSRYKIALIVNPSLSSEDFLKEIVYQLESKECKGTKLDLLHKINDILYKSKEENKDVVLIVDEAQAINSQEMFEELRLLLNFQLNDRFLLTILLVGQPELREKINKLPQLKQRMAISFHLNVLTPSDTALYIEHRCKVAGAQKPLFSNDAHEVMAINSGGIPRKINTYCELALMQAMIDKKNIVDDQIAKDAIEDINA